jgi:hypothetical protein
LIPEEKSLLEIIFQNPTFTITKLYQSGHFSAYMGDKLKRSLLKKGYIQEVKTHLGKGFRIAKFLLISPHGFTALGISYGPEHGKGGPLHRYFQSVIARYGEQEGFIVTRELKIADSTESVDLVFEKEGVRVGVEISITTTARNEIQNIQKCIRANYTQVLVLLTEEAKVAELKTILSESISPEDERKVKVGLIYSFCEFIK